MRVYVSYLNYTLTIHSVFMYTRCYDKVVIVIAHSLYNLSCASSTTVVGSHYHNFVITLVEVRIKMAAIHKTGFSSPMHMDPTKI